MCENLALDKGVSIAEHMSVRNDMNFDEYDKPVRLLLKSSSIAEYVPFRSDMPPDQSILRHTVGSE